MEEIFYAHLSPLEKNFPPTCPISQRFWIFLTSAPLFSHLSSLEKKFIHSTFLYGYSHFGKSFFSDFSLVLIEKYLLEETKLAPEHLNLILRSFKDNFFAQIDVWHDNIEDILAEKFAQLFCKKLLSTAVHERTNSGLLCFSSKEILKLLELFSRIVEKHDVQEEFVEITSEIYQVFDKAWGKNHADFVTKNLLFLWHEMSHDLLKLIFWRVEAFVSFTGLENDSVVVDIKHDDTALRQAVALMVIALPPGEAEEFGWPQTPYTPQVFQQILLGKTIRPVLNLAKHESLFFGSREEREAFAQDVKKIEYHLKYGQEHGLFFQLVQGKKVVYGLSKKAFEILNPIYDKIQISFYHTPQL